MAPLSISKKKLIRSLARKKVRLETGMFLVEGDKIVREILRPVSGSIGFRVEMLAATGEWIERNREAIPGGTETLLAGDAELRQLSLLREPNRVIAVVRQASYQPDPQRLRESLSLGLENIQDPGNLGTILRIADWFGIRDIICSDDCVELYNPKVIQSTMGSFLRVRVHTLDLPGLIGRIRQCASPGTSGTAGKNPSGDAGRSSGNAGRSSGDAGRTSGNAGRTSGNAGRSIGDAGPSSGMPGYPVFGTAGKGESLYESRLPEAGMILLGNESQGLSASLLEISDRILSIPFHDTVLRPDSLNVAVAAAILCAEFRRQAAVYSK